jgi:hypothetical protein
VAFWYSLDQISAKQPSEEAADGSPNHGSDGAADRPNRSTGRGTARDLVNFAVCATNLIKFVTGQQHGRCKRLISGIHHCFAPAFYIDAGRH